MLWSFDAFRFLDTDRMAEELTAAPEGAFLCLRLPLNMSKSRMTARTTKAASSPVATFVDSPVSLDSVLDDQLVLFQQYDDLKNKERNPQ